MTMYDDAQAIVTATQAKLEQIRRNDALTLTGKQQHMAPVWANAKAQLDKIASDAREYRESRTRSLQRNLFGINTVDPIAQMSHRDAYSRAQAIAARDDLQNSKKDEIAQSELQRALRDGDDSMAKALASVGHENGWTNVVATYATAKPEVAAAFAEIQQLQETVQSKMTDAMYFRMPKPTELDRMHDSQIEALAQQPAGAS